MAAAESITTVDPSWILNLHVRVIGAPGTVTGLDIVSAVVNEGDAGATTTDGSLTVIRESSILGWVLYHADLQAVPNVVLTGTGAAAIEATTDTDGRYQLGPTKVGDYQVTLSRGNGSLAAIDALDAADILRHLIGSLTLSQGQRSAADVSGNGIIGTTDAGLILRFLVGLESTFPAGSFWQFSAGEQSAGARRHPHRLRRHRGPRWRPQSRSYPLRRTRPPRPADGYQPAFGAAERAGSAGGCTDVTGPSTGSPNLGHQPRRARGSVRLFSPRRSYGWSRPEL